MSKLTGFCLQCEQGFAITEQEIMLALKWTPTIGKTLIGCTHCGTVYELPKDLNADNMVEWIAKVEAEEAGCCPCLPLKGAVAVMPVGRFEHPKGSGKYTYKPGGAQAIDGYPDGMPARVYMHMFGVDPRVQWALSHPNPEKPFEVS